MKVWVHVALSITLIVIGVFGGLYLFAETVFDDFKLQEYLFDACMVMTFVGMVWLGIVVFIAAFRN
jgi:hypothetical protein